MEFIAESIDKTKEIAKDFSKNLVAGDIVFLYGELGSSKTTFTGFVANNLGFTGQVQSPTFVLERIYETKDYNLHHIDLYRMNREDLSLLEFINELDKKAVYFIEWPEVIEDIIKPTKIIKFEHISEYSRKIIIN